jgi:hypothetical protein
MNTTSVILANLTPSDYRRIEEFGITCSGSTGVGAKPESYNGMAPYIATFVHELDRAIAALEWDDIHIQILHNQWIVRGENKISKQERVDKLRRRREEIIKDLCDNGNELAEALHEVA